MVRLAGTATIALAGLLGLTYSVTHAGSRAAGGIIDAVTPPSPVPSVVATLRPLPTSPTTPKRTIAGWPGPTNTGWRHTGVTLRLLACAPGGGVQLDQPGMVVDGRDIPCDVLVVADDVTVRRSRITSGAPWVVRTKDGVRNFRIEDSELVGKPGCSTGLGFAGWTALRVDIHGCADGAHTEESTLLQDSWVHGLWRDDTSSDPPHNDGVQDTGGSRVTIRHNRIENPHHQTSCILIGGEYGAPSHILIEDNYLDGGNYTIYLDPKGTDRVIRGNVLTRRHVYGPGSVGGSYLWQGNHYLDGAPSIA